MSLKLSVRGDRLPGHLSASSVAALQLEVQHGAPLRRQVSPVRAGGSRRCWSPGSKRRGVATTNTEGRPSPLTTCAGNSSSIGSASSRTVTAGSRPFPRAKRPSAQRNGRWANPAHRSGTDSPARAPQHRPGRGTPWPWSVALAAAPVCRARSLILSRPAWQAAAGPAVLAPSWRRPPGRVPAAPPRAAPCWCWRSGSCCSAGWRWPR